MCRLNLEIQRFHEHARPSEYEAVARKHLIEQVRQHVQLYLPDYMLEVFGSERTGLSFASSDIDLRLVPKNDSSDIVRSKMKPDVQKKDLILLQSQISHKHKADYMYPVIRWTRHSLLSLQDRASGLHIQLVLANDSSRSREYIQRYVQEYSYLPQLYSVIKATLDVRGLTDVYRGGVGSYSLLMMIVTSLKHRVNVRKDAAGGLQNFLHFWAHFDTTKYGLNVDPPDDFLKSEQAITSKNPKVQTEVGA